MGNTVIRAKFIGLPGNNAETIQFLVNLHWRQFECLVERLYNKMGYDTQLTPPQKDEGRDIIASRQEAGKHEHLRIECKRYSSRPVGIGIVQRLLGVASGEKVNKGVLVTTSHFSGPARRFADENPRIELIDGDQLVRLLNEYLGSKWPFHIERYITECQRKR